jgi:subtilisin family serine protease
MTEADRFKIISEEYADLIVKYNEDLELLDIYPDSSSLIINRQYAFVYIPVNRFTDSAMLEFNYASIPNLYGLTSEASLNASGITDLRNIPNLNLRGEGTLVGIVDTGIDYTNPVFQNRDGGTRIAALWDQTIDSGNYPEGMFYGTEYTRDQLNEAIRSANPLDIVPSVDEDGHGTMIAGIAAGSESPENDFLGVASMAELVVVKLKPAKNFIKNFFRVPDSSLCFQENDIMAGVQFLVNVARRERKPIAICIALGSSFSSHDGRDFLSDYLSTQGTAVGTAIAIAAGNEGNARRHYFGSVSSEQNYDTVELNVGENENDFSMELWGAEVGIFSIDILSPSGEYIPRITGGIRGRREIRFLFERTIINVDYLLNEIQSGDPLILVRFTDPAPGIWRFRVYNSVAFDTPFHIWLPMGDFISNNTYFLNPDPNTTVLSPANAIIPMSVTAYNSINQALYLNASSGYTRINLVVPDFAAPGVNITAPTLNHSFTSVTGTGAAAAHTAGVASMLLEWGILGENLPRMNTLSVKLLLIRGAERNIREEYPNRNWGYGILNIFNTFQVIRGAVDTSFI